MGTYAEISYGLFDVTAKLDSTPACSDKQIFVNTDQLKQTDLAIGKYGTCEPNNFVLDGSMLLFPDTPANENFGLWSLQMSDANGNFATPIVLTINFTQNHSSLGLTMRFFEATDDFCNSMNIKYYDSSNALLLNKDYLPDKGLYFADGQVENYRKIVITFNSTNYPYRYLKLSEIKYGALKTFDKDSIISAQILEEVDPTSAELSINTLDFSIYTSDFQILDPQGIYTLLQKKQAVEVAEYVDGTKEEMGTFYLDVPESDSNNTTNMSCLDAIGIMDQTNFKGGIYTAKSVTTLVSEIMASAGFSYELDSSYANVTLSGWIPISSHREALQQVAIAIGAIVDCSRSGKVKLYPAASTSTHSISQGQKIDDHKVTQKSLVTGVEVTAHTYIAGAESTELYNQSLMAGTYEITFGKPHHTLSCTGGTITESNANYAKITVASAGTAVLTGKPYNDNTVKVGVYTPELPAGEKTNVLQVTDAYLISSGNAAAVAQRIYNYYQMRYQGDGRIILSDEEVGNMATMVSLSSKSIKGLIESMDIDLTGGNLAKIKITGEAV